MTREEAINEIKSWDFLEGKEIEAIHTLIPELKESEDERVIKTLQEYVKNRNWPLNGPTQDEVLAWLEKQKECLADNSKTSASEDERIMKELIFFLKEEIQQCSIKEHAEKLKEFVSYLEKQKYDRMKPIYDARESFESALEKAWNDYHNGYENVDKLEDDYVECAHAKGFREGYLFGIEKQKEQKPEWGEEDEKTINELCDIIASNAKNGYLGGCYAPDLVEKLKSLRPQPKQEWSEEDKNMWTHLNGYLNGFSCSENAIKQMADWFYELPNRFNLQAKQERNEEDEKVRKWLLEYFYLHRDDLRGASVTSMEILSFLDNHPGKGKACDVNEGDGKAIDIKDYKWYACTDAIYNDGRIVFSPGDIVLGRSIGRLGDSVVSKHFAPVFFPYDDPVKFTEDVVGPVLPSKYSDFTRELEYWFGQVPCNYENNGCPDWKMDEYAKEYVESASEKLIPLASRETQNETEFNPKPGEKFRVRCKTDKSPWFDKGDERPAYAAANVNGVIIYIVHMNEDGSGNCVSYQDKEKFLETFDIVDESDSNQEQ